MTTNSNESPLSQIQRAFSPRISVESVEEQARSRRVTADMQSSAANMAPSFRPTPTLAPYDPITPVAVIPRPQAGGSSR
jgi:hypothetical protein